MAGGALTVYRRRKLAMRKMYRKKRIYRKRRGMSAGKIYNFKRTQYLSNALVIPLGSSITFNAFSFNLASLPDVTNFTALFDQYMIKRIKWTLIPRTTDTSLTTGAATYNTQTYSVIDWDDVNVPTSLNDLCQYQNMKATQGSKIHSRSFAPSVRITAEGTTNAPKQYQWIDLANTTVPHYGIKCAFAQGSASQIYDIRVDMSIAFKGVH